ncbi:MAG TPA: hypothetical protein VFD82_15840 [Planctomycetota bacterium]|nr:hypothetical protein [Planctomycetota bacterium]
MNRGQVAARIERVHDPELVARAAGRDVEDLARVVLHFFTQGFSLDPGANAAGLVASNLAQFP